MKRKIKQKIKKSAQEEAMTVETSLQSLLDFHDAFKIDEIIAKGEQDRREYENQH